MSFSSLLYSPVKRVLIFIGILGILYAAYMIFFMPSGYIAEADVVNGYIANLSSEDVCEKHFNTETQDHCESMTGLLEGHTVVVTDTTANGDDITLTITVDGVEMESGGVKKEMP